MHSRKRIEVVPDIEEDMCVSTSCYSYHTTDGLLSPVSKQHNGLYRSMTWLLPVEESDLPMMVCSLLLPASSSAQGGVF